ncbi:STAS domain-containing protein [Sorangium sp. So ce1389]|uniref:STAS domain-containing protein n=1 Tax=Sorangium sp. So ce1389 TaxID=3133336 RepID=UPI003F62F683
MMSVAPDVLFREFFTSSPELFFIASAEGGLLLGSNALREVLGSAIDEGKALADLAHPDDRAALLEAWSQLEQADGPVSVRVRLRDAGGAYRWLSCNARRSPDRGAVFGSLQAAPDVAEKELKTLRIKARVLDAIAEHMDNIALWALDRNADCFYHDGKGLANAGLKRGQLVGVNWIELYGNEPGVDSVDIPSWFDGKVRCFRAESYGVYWEMQILPLRDESGEPGGGVLGVGLDVSQSKLVEGELRAQLEQIESQQRVIRELSTPIIEVWDGVLTLPMVGTVDSARTADVMDSLLSKIVEKQARYAILDLTGVEVVDTRVASHLIELVTAIRLLGADGIVAGIKPNVAQTMVALGLDLSQLNTQRNLRAALNYAIRSMTRAEAAARSGSPPAGGAPAT